MRLIPIFDTSAIIRLSKRNASELASLISMVPQHGWPLSFVTVLELFNGLSKGGVQHFDKSMEPVNVAWRLSRGRVLCQSIPFVQKELFRIVASRAPQASVDNLERCLAKLQLPSAKIEFAAGKFTVLPKIERLVATTHKGHTEVLEHFVDEKMPHWRSQRKQSGSPMPPSERDRLKRTLPVGKWKLDLAGDYVAGSFNGSRPPQFVRLFSERCDAYLTFAVSVLRDSFMTRYRFEDNANDFHDGMQLLYLSRSHYCLVTEDARLIGRVKKSSQSERIVTIAQFLSGAKQKLHQVDKRTQIE